MKKRLYNTIDGFSLAGFEMEGYIEGSDIFNSNLLYKLSTDQGIEREEYIIRTEYYRPDLIAKKFYGDTRYESFVILQAGSMKNLVPGNKIKLITKSYLDSLGDKM